MADDGTSLTADEELAIGGRRLPRRLVAAVLLALVASVAAWALVVVTRPDIAAGHGSVAAATAQRYHDEHIGSRPTGPGIRGFFLL